MFERVAKRNREVVILAQAQAQALDCDSVGAEHIPLGLLRAQEGPAARALERLDISADGVFEHAHRRFESSGSLTGSTFMPEGKRALELALRGALAFLARWAWFLVRGAAWRLWN